MKTGRSDTLYGCTEGKNTVGKYIVGGQFYFNGRDF